MAVLASTGAAMAQVTITGNYTVGYKQSSTTPASNAGAGIPTLAASTTEKLAGGSAGNASGDASGLGIDTSLVTFNAKEDLGSGMSVAAEMSIDGLNRGGVSGGDSSLKLTTGVGRFTLQTYKPVDYLSGGIAGVGGVGMDNKVFPARTFKDSVGFDTKLGPVYIGIAHFEQGTKNAVYESTVPGLGVGGSGDAQTVGQRTNSYSVTYVGGPLIANVNYLTYDNRTTGAMSNLSYKDVVRTAVSYDFGVAKVGAGFMQLTLMSGGTLTDGLVAVSVPVGALTLGANFATETAANLIAQPTSFGTIPAGGLDQTRNGYGFSATYALSKRTSIIANYANWLAFGGFSQRNTETNLLLSHSF